MLEYLYELTIAPVELFIEVMYTSLYVNFQ